MKTKLTALLIVLSITPALADFWSGNDLHRRLQSETTHDKTMAMAYVMGVSDAYQNVLHCSGNTVTTGQTRDVVKQFLEQNPALRDMAAESLVGYALKQAFPCPEKKGQFQRR